MSESRGDEKYVRLPGVTIPHAHVTLDDRGSSVSTVVPCLCQEKTRRTGTREPSITGLRRYPQLGPARIFDALAFAYDNLELISADILREREEMREGDRR